MKDNVIRSKSFQFAVDTVNMYKEIQQKNTRFFDLNVQPFQGCQFFCICSRGFSPTVINI
jgi:hypothetical protein